MDAAVGVLLKKSGDGRLFTERQQQLDLRVLQTDEDNGDAVIRKIFRLAEVD